LNKIKFIGNVLKILNLFCIFAFIIYYKELKLIRNYNPHIRITRLNNIHALIITVFTVIALFSLLNRNSLFLFQSLTAPSFFNE